MNRLIITEDTQIYAACPASYASGGPELLHQLVFELTKLGFNAKMCYYNVKRDINPVSDAYTTYGNKFVLEQDLKDIDCNILICPEVRTDLIYNYKNLQRVIWWLSFDNYFPFNTQKSTFSVRMKRFLYALNLYPSRKIYRFNKNDNIINIAQSKYAIKQLQRRGVNDVLFLSDYLNTHFIEQQMRNMNAPKRNIVIYNPKKGLKFTNAIKTYAPQIEFIPIENMSREEVASLMSSAKVYIDFGNHPGKDRLPRESAISGCCVITGRDGSAGVFEDVPLADEFKYDAKSENIPLIVRKIEECFFNYELESKKFDNYRLMIKNEHKNFINEIKAIFQAS